MGICDLPSLRTDLPDRMPAVVVARRTPLRFLTAFRGTGADSAEAREPVFFLSVEAAFFLAAFFFVVGFFLLATDLLTVFFLVVLRDEVVLAEPRDDALFCVVFFLVAFFFAICTLTFPDRRRDQSAGMINFC